MLSESTNIINAEVRSVAWQPCENGDSAYNLKIMADKIVAYVSQHTIRIVVTEQSKVQQVINALMAMAKLFHYEKYFVVVHEEAEVPRKACPLSQVEPVGKLPLELDSDEARRVLDALVGIHVLDENYQPLGLSWYQRGFLAKRISEKLGIRNVWKVMGKLWGLTTKESLEALRSSYYKAYESADLADFIDRIKHIV